MPPPPKKNVDDETQSRIRTTRGLRGGDNGWGGGGGAEQLQLLDPKKAMMSSKINFGVPQPLKQQHKPTRLKQPRRRKKQQTHHRKQHLKKQQHYHGNQGSQRLTKPKHKPMTNAQVARCADLDKRKKVRRMTIYGWFFKKAGLHFQCSRRST